MKLFLIASGNNFAVVRAPDEDAARALGARAELERMQVDPDDETEYTLNYFIDGWQAMELFAEGDEEGIIAAWWSTSGISTGLAA